MKRQTLPHSLVLGIRIALVLLFCLAVSNAANAQDGSPDVSATQNSHAVQNSHVVDVSKSAHLEIEIELVKIRLEGLRKEKTLLRQMLGAAESDRAKEELKQKIKNLLFDIEQLEEKLQAHVAEWKKLAEASETESDSQPPSPPLDRKTEVCEKLSLDVEEDIKRLTAEKKIEIASTKLCSGDLAKGKNCVHHILDAVRREAVERGGVIIMETSQIVKDGKLSEDSVEQVFKAKVLNLEPMTVRYGDNAGTGTLAIETDDGFSLKYRYLVQIEGVLNKVSYREKVLIANRCLEVPKFEVVTVSPADGEQNVPVDATIEIELNHVPTENKSLLRRSVHLKTEGWRIPVDYRMEGRRIILVPKKRLKELSVYTLTLKKQLRNRNGKRLDRLFSYQFKTRSSFRYVKINDIEFAFVKGGSVTMGSAAKDAWIDEKPVHILKLHGFYMSKYEISREQWHRILGSTDNPPSHPNLPVTNIDIDQIARFIEAFENRLPEDTLVSFVSLPSEAQWEHACKGGAGNDSRYGIPNDNYMKTTNHGHEDGGEDERDGYKTAAPIDSFGPNVLGIYNLSGNVAEWTEDPYCKNIYRERAKNQKKGMEVFDAYNPEGSATDCNTALDRVVRGGSWFTGEHWLRCSARDFLSEKKKADDIGFRLVIVKEEEENFVPAE